MINLFYEDLFFPHYQVSFWTEVSALIIAAFVFLAINAQSSWE